MSEPSLDKNLFCSPYPASEAAVVPEYFRPQTIEDLTPYECVYPYAHMLVRDIDKGTLYINTRNSLESDDIAPTYIGGRFGVMKVCQMQGDQINSLFIVDMRYVEPSSLNGDYLCPDSAQDEMTRNNRQATIESNGAVPVAAAVFADPDGKPLRNHRKKPAVDAA